MHRSPGRMVDPLDRRRGRDPASNPISAIGGDRTHGTAPAFGFDDTSALAHAQDMAEAPERPAEILAADRASGPLGRRR
jgi:hypothetical protein